MEYREIIKLNVEKVTKKKAKEKDKNLKKYWEWIMGQLLEDLKDFETGGQQRWERW